MSRPHIVIIGSGFAALTAVRELRRRDRGARITLIAPKAELMYYPSLIWGRPACGAAPISISTWRVFWPNTRSGFTPGG